MDKRELRKRILEQRDALSIQECRDKSICITKQVIKLEGFKRCNKILLYQSMRSEVETQEIYFEAQRLGKQIYYPRVQGQYMAFYLITEDTEFEISAFGIKEPIPESTLELELSEGDEVFVLIPGVVFDKRGNRIGYGGGYYDKYLCWLEHESAPEHVCKVAIAYECQLVEEGMIEQQPYDVPVDYIVTEERNERISN